MPSNIDEISGLLEGMATSDLLLSLEAIDREALILHHLEGFSVREISAIADVPEGTVKSRLNRARRQVREHLETGKEWE